MTPASDSSTPSDNQSVTEVLIRLLATHIFGLAIYGHFGSLAKIPSKTHALYVVTFLFYPSIIQGQISVGVFRAARYYLTHRRDGSANDDFYFQGSLGVRATQASNSALSLDGRDENDDRKVEPLPLFQVGHQRLRRTIERASWRWFGRLLLILAALGQSVGTCVVFVRRQNHGCGLLIDMILGVMAFGSSIMGTIVLYLHCARTKWTFDPASLSLHEQRPERHRAIYSFTAVLVLAGYTVGQLRGSYLFTFILPPLFMLSPAHLLSLTIILLFLYFARKERHAVGTTMITLRHLTGLGLAITLACLIFVDTIISFVLSCNQLVDAKQDCWKDPLSDMMFVI